MLLTLVQCPVPSEYSVCVWWPVKGGDGWDRNGEWLFGLKHLMNCLGLCFLLGTVRNLFNQLFSASISQSTSVLGDVMDNLKKKIHGKICSGKCCVKVSFFLKRLVRALSCEGPLWTPERDSVCSVGSLGLPPMLTFCKLECPHVGLTLLTKARSSAVL